MSTSHITTPEEQAAVDGTKVPTLVDRYAPNSGVVDASANANKPFGNGPGSASLVDNGAAREKYRSQAMGTIDAIRSQFDQYIKDDTEQKRNLESKAYLSALAGGRAGGPSGATEEFNAGQKGEAQVKKDIAARETEIAKVLQDADTRGSAEFEKQRADYVKGEQDATAAHEKLNATIKTQAESDIKAFSGAYSYDDWAAKVGPKRVQQYMKETGRDEAGLRALFITHKPEGTKEFEKQVGDNYVIGYKDPITGKTSVETIPLPKDGGDWKFQIIDKKPYFVDTKSGRVKPAEGYTGSPSTDPGTPVKGAPSGFTTNDITKARNMLTNGSFEGYANPYMYKDAYNDWVTKGGDPKAFLNQFPPATYINPAHNSLKDNDGALVLPAYLQTKSKSATPTGVAPASSASAGERSY